LPAVRWESNLPPALSATALLHHSERTLVARCHSTQLGAVVLKTTAAELPDTLELARYRHEHSVLSRLQSSGVVRALGLEELAGRPMLMLEDTGGQSLAAWFSQRRPTAPEALSLMTQAAAALDRVHVHGIVHRDLSPANLVWTPETGRLQIIDFGLATMLDRLRPGAPPLMPVGTLAYMSPEQTGRLGRGVDARSDLYGLGATFWRLLIGRPPFEAADTVGLIHAHLAQPPTPPHALREDVPEDLSSVLMKLLAKEPDDRYQSAAGLLSDLQRCSDRGGGERFELGSDDRPLGLSFTGVLVGRASERARLLEAYAETRRGRWSPQLVTGPAGIGKSALVGELARAAALDGGFFVIGEFDPQRRDLPYSAWVAALRQLLRRQLAEGEAALTLVRQRAEAAAADGAAFHVWTDALPELRHLMGDAAPTPDGPELEPAAARARVHASLVMLLRVLCRPDRLVVLVLDDLNHADSASLDLLQTVGAEHNIPGLLLVATCKTEPGSVVALTEGVSGVFGATTLQLGLLDQHDIGALIARCCHRTPEAAAPLAALLMQKTAGNPHLLVTQLKRLERDELLRPEVQGWGWDLAAVDAIEPDGDGQLLVAELARLPAACGATLSAAAVMGRRFNLRVLAAALERDAAAVAASLEPAVSRWLVAPEESVSHDRVLHGARIDAWYRFGLEQVREAAAAQLSEADTRVLRRALGLALAQPSGDTQTGSLFEIVGHLDDALPLLTPEERLQLAELALLAGHRAWASAAFASAFDCFDAGSRSLGEAGWDSRYALARDLAHGACRAAQVAGLTDSLGRYTALVIHGARGLADQSPAWIARCTAAMAAGRFDDAIDLSDEFLRLAGQRQPRRLNPLAVAWGLVRTLWLLGGRPPEQLLALPEAREPLAVSVQHIQMVVASAQFVQTPRAIPQAVLRDVRAVLTDGVTALGAQCWTGLAMLLIAGLGRVELATRFGQLSLDQVTHLRRPDIWPRAAFVQYGLILPWSVPHRDLVEPMADLIDRALIAGNPVTAMNASELSDYLLFFTGAPLSQVDAAAAATGRLSLRHRVTAVATLRRPLEAMLKRLRGEQSQVPEVGPESPQPDRVAQVAFSLMMALFFGLEDSPVDWDALDSPRLKPPVPFFLLYYVWFYAGVLALVARRRGLLSGRRARPIVRYALKQARLWAKHRPERGYRVLWLQAAQLQLRGRVLPALRRYEEALEGARSEGVHQDAALIAEHAAELCEASGLERSAKTYAREALGAYRSWGATAKVSSMESSSRMSPPESIGSLSTLSRSTEGAYALDLLSLMKASQALSEEVVYRRLLERIMTTLLENAGATRGLVVLDNPDGPTVEAVVSATPGAPPGPDAPTLPRALEDADLAPTALIQFVLRTGESLVLADAAREGAYTWSPYVREHKPRSVLCVPLGRGAPRSGPERRTIRGAVYLENTLVTGCFTPDRLETVRLLTAQAAISLENAHLVDSLETKVAQRTRELEIARKRAEISSEAKSHFLTNMSHELRTPLNAILGYAQLLRERSDLDRQQREGLDTIQRSGEHLLGLINDVLDMSRIEAGRFELEVTPVKLADLIKGVVDIFRVSARQKGLSLSARLPETLPRCVLVDERRIRQILLNLIGNAVKFTDRGWIEVAVSRAPGSDEHERLTIAVRDTGCGIAAGSLATIFEPFEQVGDTERRAQGTGLGLPISQEIAGMMGGRIHLESSTSEPSGSAFTLVVPLNECEPDGPTHGRPQPEPIAAPPVSLERAELQALHQMALTGNLSAIADRAREMAQGSAALAPFAEHLSALAGAFDDRGIEALLEQLLEDGARSEE